MQDPEILAIEEAADLLHTSKSALYQWRTRDYGPPAAKVGRRLLYRREDVLAWLASQTEVAA